jgi:hypothetical protein
VTANSKGGSAPWANDSQEMLTLTLLLSRYPDFAEVFELAAIALQYNRALHSLRRAGCVIHNLYWPKSASGERRSHYRLIWCPAHLAPENHPATRGPRPTLLTKSTKAEPGLRATKSQIEQSRPLSFQRGPLQKAGIDPTAVSFRLDPATAIGTKSRSSAQASSSFPQFGTLAPESYPD